MRNTTELHASDFGVTNVIAFAKLPNLDSTMKGVVCVGCKESCGVSHILHPFHNLVLRRHSFQWIYFHGARRCLSSHRNDDSSRCTACN